MTAPKRTRFLINLPGFTAELEGERKFVEDLYRKISRDVGPFIAAGNEARRKADSSPEEDSSIGHARGGGYTWVYLCTELFNKVYVVDNSVLDNSALGRFVDPDRVRRVYLNNEGTAKLTGLTSGSRTLWAEFTDEGRALLRTATDEREKSKA